MLYCILQSIVFSPGIAWACNSCSCSVSSTQHWFQQSGNWYPNYAAFSFDLQIRQNGNWSLRHPPGRPGCCKLAHCSVFLLSWRRHCALHYFVPRGKWGKDKWRHCWIFYCFKCGFFLADRPLGFANPWLVSRALTKLFQSIYCLLGISMGAGRSEAWSFPALHLVKTFSLTFLLNLFFVLL